MKRILFLFLDGVGLAPPGTSNPLTDVGEAFRDLSLRTAWTTAFPRHASDSRVVRPIDATLGVSGLPQSGTGQASLFTGVNAARTVGRHFGPFPHSATYPVLDRANIFHQIQSLPVPLPVAFANAYPPQFFRADRRRWTVTTRCCAGANVSLRTEDDLRDGRALPADLTGRAWREELGLDLPLRTEQEAAQNVVALAADHAFTLFEFFLSDKVGHRRDERSPSTLLNQLDAFLQGILTSISPSETTLVLTSDHGNLEDVSHTRHTRNPVPFVAYGWAAPYLGEVHALTDVTPALVNALQMANGIPAQVQPPHSPPLQPPTA
jgi:hypothetical protein